MPHQRITAVTLYRNYVKYTKTLSSALLKLLYNTLLSQRIPLMIILKPSKYPHRYSLPALLPSKLIFVTSQYNHYSFDTLRSLEKLTCSDEMMFSSSPPDHRHYDSQAGEDTTNNVVTSHGDFRSADSSGPEEFFSDRPAHAAAEAGKRLASPPVASDAMSTPRLGSHSGLEIDSISESDIDIEGDGVTRKHDAGNTATGGVTDTADMSSWAGLEDPRQVDGDFAEAISAPDWLDVTHAMLDQTISGPGVE